jgi:hypothetical protein
VLNSIDYVAVEYLAGRSGEIGDLYLALDGIDTGILLGAGGAQNTYSGAPQNAAAILAALKEDGELEGTIIDKTSGETISIPNPTGTLSTTLQIFGDTTPSNGGGGGSGGGGEFGGAGGGGATPITQGAEQNSEPGEIDQTSDVS